MRLESTTTESRARHSTTGEFFVIGGTLRRDAPSYVPRRADEDLFDGLVEGKFCYVLTSRQMGKSSLMVRTAVRLREEGFSVAVLDLTSVGQNLTPEQWYDGLLSHVGRQLDLEDELETFWIEHDRLGPLNRWMRALREVVLPRCPKRLIVFIDEIDAVRSLPFSTDEFFAAIRECFNRRTEDPELARLTFCLLGVASPSDLIRDTRTTPFNIGRRIELNDFTPDEARALVRGLRRDPATGTILLERILYWTNGHPYLTQRFCRAVAENEAVEGTDGVDRLCEELFLATRARELDDNLLFVRERLLRAETDLAGLLEFHARILNREFVRDDDTNPLVGILRLAGVTRVQDNQIRVRNRIYQRVFDRDWVAANMPDAEIRRQKIAYRRGIIRTTAFSLVILAVLVGLLVLAVKQRNRAEAQELSNRRLLYAAQMNLSQQAWEDANIGQVLEFLDTYRPKPHGEDLRGFEWYYLWRLCHNRLTTLQSTALVYTVAFSPNGRLCAAGNSDSTIKLWEVGTGRELATLRGHVGWVYSVAFSPDGKLLASGGEDGTVKIWDLASFQVVHVLTDHKADVNCVAFSPDGKRLATGSDDFTVKLWDATTWQVTATLEGHGEGVNPVAFSPDGRMLATGSKDTTVKLWDVTSRRLLATLAGHTDWVRALAFSPDGKTVATAGMDNTLRLWDVPTRREFSILKGHRSLVHSVAYSPDGTKLVTGSWDNTVKIWEVRTQQELTTLRGHLNRVWAVAFSPDGRTLATGSEDQTVKFWDVEVEQEWTTLKRDSGRVTCLDFASDGRLLAAGTGYQFPTGKQIVTEETGTARIWDTASGSELISLTNFTHPVWAVAFSPENGLLATATGDAHRFITQSKPLPPPEQDTLKVWDVKTGKAVERFAGLRLPIWTVDFSPDGRLLAVGGAQSLVKLIDTATGREVRVLRGHTGDINSVAFSPDGRLLATASDDKTVKLWNPNTGLEIAVLAGHSGIVEAVRFSADGNFIATGSRDKTARIWDAETGRELFSLTGHRTHVTSVAFSPDGKRLVTGSQDGTAKLWDTVTGRQLAAFKEHAGWVNAVAFSGDGKILVTGSQDSTIKLWRAAAEGEVGK